MGQQEVYNLLCKSKVPLSASEISSILEIETIKASKILSRLLKFNEIECILINKEIALKKFKCKKSMRLYYV